MANKMNRAQATNTGAGVSKQMVRRKKLTQKSEKTEEKE